MSEMLESIAPELWLIAAGVALLIAVASFAIGRRSGFLAQQIRELTGALDDARAEADGARDELDRYRGSVADHFAETSEKLRDLTLQYRSVYDHLAAGANSLCPEGFQLLEEGLAADALPQSAGPEELETDELLPSDSEPEREADLDPELELDAAAVEAPELEQRERTSA